MTDQISVVIRDSALYAPDRDEPLMTLFFPRRQITARELIRERVLREVQAYNDRLPEMFKGLIAPSDAERTLNGYRMPKPRTIDPEKQCGLACRAFEENGFLLLVNDRQVSDLDETIELGGDTSVVFLKLTPLVGG